MKLFVNWKKKYEETKRLYDSECRERNRLRIDLKLARDGNTTRDRIIAEKNEEIKELKRKLDILHAYYDF